jgi:hypothetical protein
VALTQSFALVMACDSCRASMASLSIMAAP